MPIRAIRGATQVERDEPGPLLEAVTEMLEQVLQRNDVAVDDLISAVFTSTPDLRSDFPAYAARQLGWSDVPLLGAVEVDVPGALPRVVRVLVHVETTRSRAEVRHVYLRGAAALRTDLPQ